MKKSKAVDKVLEHLSAQESREISGFVFFTKDIKERNTVSFYGKYKAVDLDYMIEELKEVKRNHFNES